MTDTAQWLLSAATASGILGWLIYSLSTNLKNQKTMDNNKQSYQDKINGMDPEKAAIIAQALSRYEPIVPPAACGDNCTSFEIAELLGDITTLQTAEVGSVMVRLGYYLHLNSYKGYEWSMRQVYPMTYTD